MIPKMLHFMWLPDIQQVPEQQQETPAKWGSLNPEYFVRVWGLEDVRELIADNYLEYLDIWEGLDMPIKQADLGRLLVMHKYGGVYLDMDLQPLRPLEEFFGDGCVYNKAWTHAMGGTPFPDVPSEHFCDLRSYSSILSREHRPIDRFGVGVANGVIMAEPGQDWIMEFVRAQKNCHRGLVLDYVGTWALTRFIRARKSELADAGMLTLPPHYFLWEPESFPCDPLHYCVSTHDPGGTSWYDPTVRKGFKI